MAKIRIPAPLQHLVGDSAFEAPIRDLADRVETILTDNKLFFFPGFHGIEHINSVLTTQVELIPKYVWEASLLCDVDATIMIGATLLHDVGVYLQPSGFLELIKKGTRFQPLPCFNQRQKGHLPDVCWHELWADYVREVQRLSSRDLAYIIGTHSARAWKFHDLPEDTRRWEKNHSLMIGEFIRRHHARLAHEIAIYGFPGLPVGSGKREFPALGKEKGHALERLADLIGLTARSHWLLLRLCKSNLDAKYSKTPRPMDTAVICPMALLRVADFFQIRGKRALLDQLNIARQVCSNLQDTSDPNSLSLFVEPPYGKYEKVGIRELVQNIEKWWPIIKAQHGQYPASVRQPHRPRRITTPSSPRRGL
jgi:molecular chaperone HtpG